MTFHRPLMLAALLALAPMTTLAQTDPQTTEDVPATTAPDNRTTGASDASPSETASSPSAQEAEENVTVVRTEAPSIETSTVSEAESEMSSEARTQADAEGERRLRSKAIDPIVEAASALDMTKQAIEALNADETERALTLLDKASTEIATLITRRPMLALAPAETRILERDLVGSVEAIRALADQIEDLVDDGRLQEARVLMRDFASELVMETVNLPLATYPAALTSAADAVRAGDNEGALRILATMLTTNVITEEIIPLPPLRAEAVLAEAELLLAKENRTEEEQETLRRLLEVAREQVEMGRAFGYGTRAEYRAVLDMINDIEDEMEETTVERAFARVRRELSSIFD